jgi:tetratricopeptide (TPR) repeat protein
VSDPGKAVFLSYASQDAEAARRIADALRAAGVEVWFDQEELRGGDAWDAKIRRQIHECAFFVPVISQHTQARAEGYFRREWKLGVERTHDMAEDVAFIVPVVIDNTPDATARVPEKFREVQWTRLPGGEVSNAFVDRVKALLQPEEASGARQEARGRAQKSESSNAQAQGRKALPPWRWVVPVALGVTVILAFVLWHPWQRDGVSPPASRALETASTAPVSEARALVLRVRALLEQFSSDDSSRETLALAEELSKRAVQLDPTDAEAWAVYSLVSGSFIGMSYDRSAARHEAVRGQAERAVKLAPESTEALFALASSYRLQSATLPEAERRLRDLVERVPDDKRFLRMLGLVLTREGKHEEALGFFDRATALPGGDAKAWYGRAQTLQAMGRVAEAEAAVDRSLGLQSSGSAYLLKVSILRTRGDMEQARALLAKVPSPILLEPRGACVAAYVWYLSREPEKMLAVLGNVTGDYFSNSFYEGPRGWFVGLAHELAGRPEAAQAEWRLAVQVVDQRLASQPNAATLLYWKADLLARLGEKDEARRYLHLYQQLQGHADSQMDGSLISTFIQLGEHDAVLDYLEAWMKRDPDPQVRDTLRNNPGLDPLRGNPRFEALLVPPRTNREQEPAAGNPAPTDSSMPKR